MKYPAEKFPPRPRITDTLLRALAGPRLVLVTAPPGYGKSVACRDVCAAVSDRLLSLAAKPSWRDPDAFWEAACKELARQGVAFPPTFPQKQFPGGDAALYHVLSALKELLAGKTVILAVDDYQFVSSRTVDTFVEALVREEIPELSLLFFTREKPYFPVESLRLQGYAALFGPELLLFTPDEARELFAAYGIFNADVAERAWSFSEGWATALWISLQRYRERGLLEPVRDIEKIMEELFFSGYGEEDRTLLMRLSLLDTFTSRQAAFVGGDPQAGSRLRDIRGRNPFLYYDGVAGSFSMHSLFRSYLARRLGEAGETNGIDMAELHRRAARCALDDRDELQAIRHLAQAGSEEDLLEILKLAEKPDEGLLLGENHEEILDIFRNIPWAVRRRCPIGYLGFIHRYMVRVDRTEASRMLAEAEQELAACPDLSPERAPAVWGEMELIHAVREFNDVSAMFRRWKHARDLLKGRSSLVNERMFWTFNSPHSSFLYLKQAGEYKRLLETAGESLDAFDEVSGGANAGALDILVAEHRLETGDDANIAHYLRKGEYKARQSGQYRGLVAAAFLKARMELAAGRPEEAVAELRALDDEVAGTGHPLLRYMLGLCHGYVAAVRGKLTDLPAWLFGRHLSPRQGFLGDCDFAAVVRGKALMAMKDWSGLEAHVETASSPMRSLGSLFGKIHMCLCGAVAAHHCRPGSQKAAEALVLNACEAAAEDGIITSIAEYGVFLLPLLQRLEHLRPYDPQIAVLVKRAKRYARLGLEDCLNLTARERDILERAAAGESNREIGEALGIMPGSVANTLSRVYTKLGVDCRLGAIRKWSSERMGQAI